MPEVSVPPGAGVVKLEAAGQGLNKDVAALFTNLKLQHNHYQPFTRRQTAKPVSPQPSSIAVIQPAAHVPVRVGIFSPAGGSGKSMIAASLSSILCQRGKRVLLVDASPWPSLAFHFGASESRPGRRTFFAPGAQKVPVHLLSCDESELAPPDLAGLMAETPVDYVLLDLSGLSGDRLLAYLGECDSVLVPLLPDPSAVRVAATALLLLASLGDLQVQFVLNGMDDSGGAEEVRDGLTRLLGESLFPSVILRQPEVRNALREGIVLPFYAPEAPASVVLGEIAAWVLRPMKAQAQVDSRWIER